MMSGTLSILIAAMIAVESGGDDAAKGAAGESGCLQISQRVIDDVNRFQDMVHFSHASTLNREASIAICECYLAHYASAARLGREPTDEDRARIWNGGPTGYREQATLQYWWDVRQKMQRIERAKK